MSREMEGVYVMATANVVLADVDGMSILSWLLIGLIAGALASLVMRGGGYGIIGDIVVGLIGALIGGFLMSLLGVSSGGFVGTLVVAFIGACVLIALLRLFSGSYRHPVV
jgi:uncharacterized membrane protein YeaQ/YmgE (transglycosylase-associated protein family)